ncbi:MAG TPA: hypothetical protein PLY87_00420, partial [Planctomycetaceae bacterium]|nr:hypothetical protein [Planctomycetaceae bacterium]
MLTRFFDRELFPRHDLTAYPACVWVVCELSTEWGQTNGGLMKYLLVPIRLTKCSTQIVRGIG